MANYQEVEMDGVIYEFPVDMADAAIQSALVQERAPTATPRDLSTVVAMTRGERNNNPLNIDHSEDNPWQGGKGLEKHKTPRFETFEDPVHGIRAGVKILQQYADRGQDSIRDIIFGVKEGDKYVGGWAGPHENDSEAYVDFVSKRSGINPDASLDLKDPETLRKLLDAMVRMEQGKQPYDRDVIMKGIEMAIGKPETS